MPNPIDFQTHPDQYLHWKLQLEGDVARLVLDIQENRPFAEGYVLKLNSYDLGVDIELADAVQRIRFEHPQVRVVVVESAKDRVFSSGANIKMLGQSSHTFKVNFCKFTNETRLSMEDASVNSNIKILAALNGACAGGGYELALACDRILLIDDGSSTVSLPEVPLLGVLPGTGGLTRVVDKRKVRRDHADIFCTLSEGMRGKRAVEWNLVDAIAPRSKFSEAVTAEVEDLKAQARNLDGVEGITWTPVKFKQDGDNRAYTYVTLECDQEERTVILTMRAPDSDQPQDAAGYHEAGTKSWALQAFRELDDALLYLRFSHPSCGVVILKTQGDAQKILAVDAKLHELKQDWLINEILLLMARTLRRLDLTARSFFALIEPGSCFAGSLFELALAADRSYVLEDGDDPKVYLGPLNVDAFPMSHGLSRLEARFQREPQRIADALEQGAFGPGAAEEAGLVTVVMDDIDYEDEVRVAIEERVSFSPDALTGMEASLRFPGHEICDSKIFGRLSAWQNWIFIRPNAVGEKGALKLYGRPERPEFDWRRT